MNKLPYLHRDSRSSRIPSAEIREVFKAETSRGIPEHLREDYLRRVMI